VQTGKFLTWTGLTLEKAVRVAEVCDMWRTLAQDATIQVSDLKW